MQTSNKFNIYEACFQKECLYSFCQVGKNCYFTYYIIFCFIYLVHNLLLWRTFILKRTRIRVHLEKRKKERKESFEKRSYVISKNAAQKNSWLVKLLDSIIIAENTFISWFCHCCRRWSMKNIDMNLWFVT